MWICTYLTAVENSPPTPPWFRPTARKPRPSRPRWSKRAATSSLTIVLHSLKFKLKLIRFFFRFFFHLIYLSPTPPSVAPVNNFCVSVWSCQRRRHLAIAAMSALPRSLRGAEPWRDQMGLIRSKIRKDENFPGRGDIIVNGHNDEYLFHFIRSLNNYPIEVHVLEWYVGLATIWSK